MATRRTDGFSEDGLSYAVASDFDKQLGQALAEIEARSAAPRFTPGARVESPDAPDILRRELLDPILEAQAVYQGQPLKAAAVPKVAPPKIISDRGNIWSVDPLTGSANQLVKRPESEAKVSDYRDRIDYELAAKAVEAARKAVLSERTTAGRAAAQAMLEKAMQDFQKLRPTELLGENTSVLGGYNPNHGALQAGPPAAPVSAVPAAPTPMGFMGTPGSTNLLDMNAPIGVPVRQPTIVAPGATGVIRRKFNPVTGDFE